MSGKDRRRARDRGRQGYDPAPPACANCKHYKAAIPAIPGQRPYSPSFCTYGSFIVKPRGVCDVWAGDDGSVLENVVATLERAGETPDDARELARQALGDLC